MMNRSVIIIGGGLGGLFTGALLAKEGYVVTVLEKNRIIGGGLQCFLKDGELYETGMHVLGGFMDGGSLRRICTYLNIFDKLSLRDTDKDCIDEIHIFNSGDTYRIPRGKDNFISYFSSLFPCEKANIEAYVNKLYAISEEFDLFYLRPEENQFFYKISDIDLSADELISRYIKDEKLKEILAYMNTLYGGVFGHTPSYIHALINVLYINGSSFFTKGSIQLADLLAGVIEDAGGRVVSGEKIVEINVTEKHVNFVRSESGNKYSGDIYISSIFPTALIKIISASTFNRSYVNRLNEIPTTYSAFIVYIKLKKNSFKYINHTNYFQTDYNSIWDLNSYDKDLWPKGFMYLTSPDKDNEEFASHITVNCIMDYNVVKKWGDTTVGNRGDDYKEWKRDHIERVIGKLELLFPNLRDCIETSFAASPLTIRDFYGVKNGAIYGFEKDSKNPLLSKLTIFTKVSNLYLTGQNINLHGICGVPLTAIQTAEAITGKNTIINRINKNYK